MPTLQPLQLLQLLKNLLVPPVYLPPSLSEKIFIPIPGFYPRPLRSMSLLVLAKLFLGLSPGTQTLTRVYLEPKSSSLCGNHLAEFQPL